MPAMHQMRSLDDYDISPKTGFLPSEPPLRRLEDPYFAPWESMMDDFNGLLLAGKLRQSVHKMPLLDYTRLKTVQEYRRAFLIMCMLSHSYVWGKLEKTSETLPANLAVPWSAIATHLGLCPVVCHAAVVLWNYKLLDNDGPIDLSNLSALSTYSGSLDESWFYLVTTAIESVGAPCLSAMMSSINHVQKGDYEGLLADLQTVLTAMKGMNDTLQRMYEKCDPYVFYWKIRPYLAGWENMAEAGLPFGLIYEGVDSFWSAETDEYADMSHLSEAERLLRQYRRYAGGSAAQSSLIAALDVFLGVEHYPTGKRPQVQRPDSHDQKTVNDRYTQLPTPNPADELNKSKAASEESRPVQPTFVRTNRNTFLRAMRMYMPRPHREFLEDLEHAANLRSFMMHLDQQPKTKRSAEETMLLEVYNDCLAQLKSFRDIHVQIVTLYIVNQARKGPNIAHGGFAIEKKKQQYQQSDDSQIQQDDQTRPAKKAKINAADHNVLYPQTALETSPRIRKGSLSAMVSDLFPELGLAKHVDPKTGVVRGTGGTNVLPFLKQSRDETSDTRIGIASAHPNGTTVKNPNTVASIATEPTPERRRSWRNWFITK
ncbi:Indoleamine 2,3-dioxygenase [Zychaea mexicana]|uniref:Indoleamine 2,3-dioxygenase n=1 Tax=Zychaea mexicana TaxID=64656 RepID=UPI0022FDC88D|nr:Indoleamine 2,3-dioxygenase [Zychaea mexicana]KAI9497173.1 Indoleamine 2,3-dioxygenase [Zychaea mexicana]